MQGALLSVFLLAALARGSKDVSCPCGIFCVRDDASADGPIYRCYCIPCPIYYAIQPCCADSPCTPGSGQSGACLNSTQATCQRRICASWQDEDSCRACGCDDACGAVAGDVAVTEIRTSAGVVQSMQSVGSGADNVESAWGSGVPFIVVSLTTVACLVVIIAVCMGVCIGCAASHNDDCCCCRGDRPKEAEAGAERRFVRASEVA